MDTVIETGARAPDFQLPDLDGNWKQLEDARGVILIVNFWSAECPWAKRTDAELLDYLSEWGEEVLVWSIACNANEAVEMVESTSTERKLQTVLLDPQQEVADLYGALTTPQLFVLDRDGILRYQGAFDDVTFRQRTPTRHYLRDAVEALLAGKRPELGETNPYGCAIVRDI